MKNRVNRKIAVLLAFALVFTNFGFGDISSVHAAEVNDIVKTDSAAGDILTDADTGADEDMRLSEVNAADTDIAENEEAESTDEIAEGSGDISSAEPATGNDTTEDIVSGNEADDEPETENDERDAALTQADAPSFWKVTPESAVDGWYTDGAGNYLVDLSDSAFIGFYPPDAATESTAGVTVRRKDGVTEEISVIVEGGEYSQGTAVTVDRSLSGNVLVAHGSVVDDLGRYFQVGGLRRNKNGEYTDDGDYEDDDVNTVRYESGWKVYCEKELKEHRIEIYYAQNSVQVCNDKNEDIKLFLADKTDSTTVQRYNYYGGWSLAQDCLEWMRNKTMTASADFVIRSDAGYSWLHVNRAAQTPDVSGLNVGMRIFENPNTAYEDYGVELYDKATGKQYRTDNDISFLLGSVYTDNSVGSNRWHNGYWTRFGTTELGANGCEYSLYVKATPQNINAFSSDPVKVTGAGSIFVHNRTPRKSDISEVNMDEYGITLTQGSTDWYYCFDNRGNSRLKFIIAGSGTDINTIKGIDVSAWKGRLGDYDTFREPDLRFDKVVDVSGNLVDFGPSGNVDVYAAWFLPDETQNGEGYVDPDGNGPMDGDPVKLYSFEYTGQGGTIFIPRIDFWGTSREWPGEDGPLFTEEQVNSTRTKKFFRAYTADSSQQEINGTFYARAIRKDDPNAADFMALEGEVIKETQLGRDVTEEGGWEPGEYCILIYFEPYYDDLDGDRYLSAFEKYDLHINGVDSNLYVYYVGDSDYVDYYNAYIKPVGDVISYSDLSTSVFCWDEYDRLMENEDLSLKDAKYIVRIVDRQKTRTGGPDDDPEYSHAYDKDAVLDNEGDQIELPDAGEYYVLVSVVSGNIIDDEGRDVTNRYSIYNCIDNTFGEEFDADMIRNYDLYSRNHDSCNGKYPLKVIDPGITVLTPRGNGLPYGIANQLWDDAQNDGGKSGKFNSYLREQMERLFIVSNDGEVPERNSPRERLLEYRFATAQDGEYREIGNLDKEDLELGKTLFVKAGILGSNYSDPVSVSIVKQPINIAAVCPTVTGYREALKSTYSDDVYVYYMNPYPNENPREIRGKLSDWASEDTVSIETDGIDKNKSGTYNKAKLSISLNAAKLTHYELRSTAAMYVIRSASGMEVKTDSDEEMKKTEIEREMLSVQFIDANTGMKLAPSQAWYKDGQIPDEIQANLSRENFGVWSLGADCSDKVTDITTEDIVTNSGTLYTFNLENAMKLVKGDGVSVITFYGYETQEISKYIVINEIAPVDYDGNAHVSSSEKKTKGKSNDLFISVRVKTGESSELLTEGTDYRLRLTNNKNAGEGTVTVIGKGAYKGLSAKRKFTIRPRNINDAVITVDPAYKYGKNGISIKPKVTYKDTKLKSGNNRDYTAELVEEDGSAVKGSYDKKSAPHRFRIKITGSNRNYKGEKLSEAFWGVPSNLKALPVTLTNTSVKFAPDKTFVTAGDYFTDSSKTGKFDKAVIAELYDDDHRLIEKGVDTGVYYYVGVRAANPDEAIAAGFSPAVTFKKVKFAGLKFSKNLLELSDTTFEFSNSGNTVKVKAKNGQTVSWNDVQVTFADYYKSDGDDDLPFRRGIIEPAANDGKMENILDNQFPGTYNVFITGKGRYYGTFRLTYKVKPVKAKPGENVKAVVNNGEKVTYNAGGYDWETAPVILYFIDKDKKETPMRGAYMNVVYPGAGSVANGAGLVVKSVYNTEGEKIFKNGFKQQFDLSPCDLSKALDLYQTDRGAVKKLAINLSAKVPLLTLMQRGPLGFAVIGKTEFDVEDNIVDKAKASPDKAFDLTVRAAGKNYTGGTFTVSGNDAYEKTCKKAKLKYSLGEAAGAEPENSGVYGIKNGKTPTYFKYTGKAVEPSITVKDPAGNTVPADHYDVTYENNISLSTKKNPAVAVVTFKRSPKGDFPYGGSAEIKYYIVTDYSK